jgi:tetratricopeptide (TPR) repeat protein
VKIFFQPAESISICHTEKVLPAHFTIARLPFHSFSSLHNTTIPPISPVLAFFFGRPLMAKSLKTYLPASRSSIALFFVLLFPLSASSQQTNPADFDSLAQSAAAARDSGRASDAIPLYRRALDLRPDWPEGWWYLGTLLYDANQFRDAAPAFQKVLTLAPGAPGALNFLGLCEFETGDYDSALQHLDRAYPPSSQEDLQVAHVAAYHLVLLLNRVGSFDRAAQIFAKDFSQSAPSSQIAIAFGLTSLRVPLLPSEVDPSKDALLQYAGGAALSLAQGQTTEACNAYAALLPQYPDAPSLHSAYAVALRAAGRQREAAQQLQLESQLHPQNVSGNSAVTAFYANDATRARLGLAPPANSNSGSSLFGNAGVAADQNWQQALQLFSSEHYAESIAVLKTVVVAQPQNGTAWAMLGLAEFETKDYDNALLHLQKGAALGLHGSADSVRLAKYRLGLLYIRDSRFDQASTLLVPESEGNGLSPQIQFALGLALLHKPVFPDAVLASEIPVVQSAGEISLLLHNSKYDAAFPKLQSLLQSYPATPMLHYAYGLALASFSRYDEAIAQFDAESRISPKSALPYVQLAFVELQTHHPAGALASAQRAVQLAPDSAEARYVLGRSLLDLRKFENALKELQTAARINPGSAEVHFNLAKVYAKLNRAEDAQRERERFTELNAEIERQRSQQGSQAYGAAHSTSDLSRTNP